MPENRLREFDQALKRLRFLERGDAPFLNASEWIGLRVLAGKAAEAWGRLPDHKRAALWERLAEHETRQLTVLVEPSLREAIDKARGNLTMGRFVRDAICEKIAGNTMLRALNWLRTTPLTANQAARVVAAIHTANGKNIKGDRGVEREVRS